MAERNLTLDLVKGFAIINIIFIHTVFWSGSLYGISAIVNQISLLIDVPLFFFLSGWAVNYQTNNIKRNLERLFKLYFQYCIAAIFMILSLVFIYNHHFSQLTIFQYFMAETTQNDYELPGVGWSVWFLGVFFVVYAETPLLLYIRRSKENTVLLSLILFSLVAIFTFTNGVWNNFLTPSYYLSLRVIVFYTLFYFIGIAFYDVKISLRHLVYCLFGLLTVLYFYSIGSGQIFDMQKYKFPPSLFYLLASVISVILTLYIKNFENYFKYNNENLAIRLLEYCGKNVFTIYLYQGFGGSLLFSLIPHLKIYPWYFILSICFFLNLIITLCLTVVFLKFNNISFNKLKSRYLYIHSKIFDL